MSVCDENQICPVDALAIWRTHRIPLQPGVRDDVLAAGRGDDESGVPKPRDGEGCHPMIIRALKTPWAPRAYKSACGPREALEGNGRRPSPTLRRGSGSS